MALSWRASIPVFVGIIPLFFFPTSLFFFGWLVLCALLWAFDATMAPSPRQLSIERSIDTPIPVGNPAPSRIVLRTPVPMRLDLRDAWPPSTHPSPYSHSLVAQPEMESRVTTTLHLERRGSIRADYVTVRSWGPLRMAARQTSIVAPLNLNVLPPFRAKRLLPSRLARLHELEGTTATVLRGPGTEFDSLREYVRGDDPRDIDWRASARSSDLVVRTWRPERDRHVMIVVDAGRSGAMLLGEPQEADLGDKDLVELGVAPRLDAQIEAALLLGVLADRAGDQVHMLVVDREIHEDLAQQRAGALIREAAQAFSRVQPSLLPLDWQLVINAVDKRLRHPGLVVLLTEIPPAATDVDFSEAIATLSKRHRVIVAGARDPELGRMSTDWTDAPSAFTAAAASATSRDLDAGARDARSVGAYVIDCDAGFLPARLADTYIALKKAGKL